MRPTLSRAPPSSCRWTDISCPTGPGSCHLPTVDSPLALAASDGASGNVDVYAVAADGATGGNALVRYRVTRTRGIFWTQIPRPTLPRDSSCGGPLPPWSIETSGIQSRGEPGRTFVITGAYDYCTDAGMRLLMLSDGSDGSATWSELGPASPLRVRGSVSLALGSFYWNTRGGESTLWAVSVEGRLRSCRIVDGACRAPGWGEIDGPPEGGFGDGIGGGTFATSGRFVAAGSLGGSTNYLYSWNIGTGRWENHLAPRDVSAPLPTGVGPWVATNVGEFAATEDRGVVLVAALASIASNDRNIIWRSVHDGQSWQTDVAPWNDPAVAIDGLGNQFAVGRNEIIRWQGVQGHDLTAVPWTPLIRIPSTPNPALPYPRWQWGDHTVMIADRTSALAGGGRLFAVWAEVLLAADGRPATVSNTDLRPVTRGSTAYCDERGGTRSCAGRWAYSDPEHLTGGHCIPCIPDAVTGVCAEGTSGDGWCPAVPIDQMMGIAGCSFAGNGMPGCNIVQSRNGRVFITLQDDLGCMARLPHPETYPPFFFFDPVTGWPDGNEAGGDRVTHAFAIGLREVIMPVAGDPPCTRPIVQGAQSCIFYTAARASQLPPWSVTPMDESSGFQNYRGWASTIVAATDSDHLSIAIRAHVDAGVGPAGGGPCRTGSTNCRSRVFMLTQNDAGDWCGAGGCARDADMSVMTPSGSAEDVPELLPSIAVLDFGRILLSNLRGSANGLTYSPVTNLFVDGGNIPAVIWQWPLTGSYAPWGWRPPIDTPPYQGPSSRNWLGDFTQTASNHGHAHVFAAIGDAVSLASVPHMATISPFTLR